MLRYQLIHDSRRPLDKLPAEILERIFDNLSPIDVIKASHASKTCYQIVQDYFAHAMLQLLDRFFDRQPENDTMDVDGMVTDEIQEFRSIQAETGAIISGSSVIQFFQRIFLEESDLDVYAQHGKALALGCFLERIGYSLQTRNEKIDDQKNPTALARSWSTSFAQVYQATNVRSYAGNRAQVHSNTVKSSNHMDYELFGIAQIFNFKRRGKKVQLITTRGPVLQLILSFHSTIPMNIMTHSHAYAFYPRSTFKAKRGLIITCSGVGQEPAREKYRERGWELMEDVPLSDFLRPQKHDISVGPRWVGDAKCMTVKLPGHVDIRGVPLTVWSANSWELGVDSYGDIVTKTCVVEVGQWKYCIVKEDLLRVWAHVESGDYSARLRCSKETLFAAVAEIFYQMLLPGNSELLAKTLTEPDYLFRRLREMLTT